MKINEFAGLLENAKVEHQASDLLAKYLMSFGIRYYAFTYYSGHVKPSRKLRYHTVSEALKPWHIYYLDQGYADVDRTLEESYKMSLSIFWDVSDQLPQAKNKRERRIREESIEFGIDKGLSLPIHGPNHDFCTLTLHQCRGETCLKNYELHQYEWLSATQVFYYHIKKILYSDNLLTSTYRLTKREEQCLALTAKSWRVEQIAKELKISPRTVNFHIQNANKKLGTNNKYQTINKYFQLTDGDFNK